jgi:hypothetical protein
MSGYNVTIGSTSTNVTVGYRPTLGVTQQAYGIVGPAGPGIGTTSSINTTGIITASYFVGDGSLLTNLPGSGNSGYANTAGIATYATSSGIATYATNAGIATFATNAGVSTYATNAGIATFATTAGYANTADIATYAINAGVSTYATSSGIATYATSSGISTYASTSGIATNVIGGIASVTSLSVSGISTFTNGSVLIGSGTSTGTASQRLQVTGGVYVSENIGIGTTNPTSALTVVGNTLITGIITTTSINFASGGLLGDPYGDGGTGLKASATGTQYVIVASNNLQQFLQVDDNQIFIGTGYASTTGTYDWKFDKNGALTFPDSTLQSTAFTGYASTAGIATYATNAGIATYAATAGIATYATTAAGAVYAATAGEVIYAATAGIATYATSAGISTVAQGLTGAPNISVGIITATDYRIRSVAEKTTLVDGNTVSLVYNTGGGNVAICTNPSGNITLNVTGIPTDSAFDNYSLAFSVIVTNTGTARSCTAINLNGVSETILWFGGSLSAAISGVTTSNGYDVYSFTGINTVGSASTTANYIVLGSVNGSYR